MTALPPEAVRYIIVHCSKTSPRKKVDRAYMERVHRLRGNLWLGYHWVIDRKGNIEQGRKLDQVGSHTTGFNNQSIGICLAGGADQAGNPADNFTPAQRESLLQLLAAMHQKFPQAIALGHRDLVTGTQCPSMDVKQFRQESGYVQPVQSSPQ